MSDTSLFTKIQGKSMAEVVELCEHEVQHIEQALNALGMEKAAMRLSAVATTLYKLREQTGDLENMASKLSI